MSKKHVDEYFNKVVHDYKEMLDTIHELEEECSKGLVDPDKVEQMKELIKPLKNNYMTLSWIMYLFNQPNKKQKKRKYEQVQLPIMNNIDPKNERHPEAIHEENKKVINELKDIFK